MPKIILVLLLIFLFSTGAVGIYTQEMVIIPNGVLQTGEKAEVTGDYVRIRSGPTLRHRIITKVNRGTPVSVLERGNELVTIQDRENYWYRIKLEGSDTEGWMFGHYLKKKEFVIGKEASNSGGKSTVQGNLKPTNTLKNAALGFKLPKFEELGRISEPRSLITAGDLNRNGDPEIILINGENHRRSQHLIGYEVTVAQSGKGSFAEAYRIEMRNADAQRVEIFSEDWLAFPLIVVSGETFSQIYVHDSERNILRLIYKINSPLLSMGRLDGQNKYLVYARKNRVADYDGTETYYIQAARFDLQRSRIKLSEKISYQFPLPVKKMRSFDFTGNGKADIICEVGGNNSGGGIIVLSLEGERFKRIVNAGIVTYNDTQFVQMWGGSLGEDPRLVVYSTDPEKGSDAGTSFGFIIASVRNSDLIIENFYPINKMLDDINNRREPLLLHSSSHEYTFIVMDYDDNSAQYTIKRPMYQ